jgi:fructose-1,6-bisphosphatase/inositol monophosphatase family enzyme
LQATSQAGISGKSRESRSNSLTDKLPIPISSPLTKSQRATLVNLVRRASRTEILPRFRALGAHQIDTKTGPQDLVTDADKAAEKMIARGILRMFPNALIIGEEAISEDASALEKIGGAEQTFTIDPVDGTWNFANGLSTFGVIISMLRFGRPVFGLLYDPVMDDFIIADETCPAEMVMPRRPARRLFASKGGALDSLTGYAAVDLLPDDKRRKFAALLPDFSRAMTIRCACHEARMMAQGNVDFLFATKLTPWDHAAGAIIARQAGAHVALLDGSEYTATAPASAYLLMASDAATWGRVRDHFAFLLEEPAKAK